MIPRQVVDFNSFKGQFAQFVVHLEMAFQHDVAPFEPEIEKIAQYEEFLKVGGVIIEAVEEIFFA